MNKLIFLAIALFMGSFAKAEVVEQIVAVVNTEAILESDFRILKEQAKNPFMLYKYLIPGNSSLLERGDRKASMDYLIGEKILDSEIKRLNLVVTSEKVDQEIRDIAKRARISVDDLYAQIRLEGLSKSEYQSMMKSNIERQSLLEQEIVSKIRISDEDALAEYMRRRSDAKIVVNEFSVAHIFFNPKKGSPDEALGRAQETLQRLNSGGNFEALAEQFSEDPNFTAGGLLGTFKAGEFLKEIEEAIAPLSPGQTSRIVRSRIGFHIVKLLAKKMAPDPRFQREKDAIKARLMDAAIQRQFKIWLQTKRADSFVRINKATP
jgi:peptidyl-prolyl cis-trans isomerase SurA